MPGSTSISPLICGGGPIKIFGCGKLPGNEGSSFSWNHGTSHYNDAVAPSPASLIRPQQTFLSLLCHMVFSLLGLQKSIRCDSLPSEAHRPSCVVGKEVVNGMQWALSPAHGYSRWATRCWCARFAVLPLHLELTSTKFECWGSWTSSSTDKRLLYVM